MKKTQQGSISVLTKKDTVEVRKFVVDHTVVAKKVNGKWHVYEIGTVNIVDDQETALKLAVEIAEKRRAIRSLSGL